MCAVTRAAMSVLTVVGLSMVAGRQPMMGRLNGGHSMRWIGGTLAGLAGLAAASVALPALAADDLVDDGWHFQLTPLVWAAQLDTGSITVKGQKASPSIQVHDYITKVQGLVEFDAEVRNGRFGFDVLFIYMDVGDDVSEDGVRLRGDFSAVWVDALGFYRLGPFNLGVERDGFTPTVVVDPYAGGRYNYLDTRLKVRNGGQQVEESMQWGEPIFGFKTRWDLTPRWTLSTSADIGGYVGGSKLAYQATGLIGYRFDLFGERDARVMGGYKVRHQNYSNGNGDDRFQWDMTLHGPVLALSISF